MDVDSVIKENYRPSFVFEIIQETIVNNRHFFGLVIAYRAGCLLADLAAVCLDLFQADCLFCAGGPMSGIMGKLIREYSKRELEELYGLSIEISSHPVRSLKFPEFPQKERSGAWGAGSAALELYRDLLKQSELQVLENTLRTLLEESRRNVNESKHIQIEINEANDLVIKSNEQTELTTLRHSNGWYGINKISDIADHLDTHRIKRGLYRGGIDIKKNVYSCIFIGPPDSILRH